MSAQTAQTIPELYQVTLHSWFSDLGCSTRKKEKHYVFTSKEPIVNIRNLSCPGGDQSMDVVTERPVNVVSHVSFILGLFKTF